MRKTLIAILAMAITASMAMAQQRTAYYELEQMPNAVNYLPPPPDTTSVAFACDMSLYFQGKAMRDTERGDTALIDSNSSLSNILKIFSEPFGLDINKTETPAIYTMLKNALATTSLGTKQCKEYYHRRRPFQRFNEPMYSGESLGETSYPSGHTQKAWSAALLLIEVCGDNQDAILKRAYEYGQSRVIVGAHWQSDVDAGRVVASACYARLHNSPQFLAEMAAAQAEYAELTKPVITTTPQVGVDAEPDAQWYTIDGRPATEHTRGVVVSKNKKEIR